MILKNKIINLPDGENLTLFATSENVMNLYLNKNGIKKKRLIMGDIVRCENFGEKKSCECLFELSDGLFCLCYDGNMSISDNVDL